MWWVISLVSLVLLVIETVVTTFFLIVMLNGFPSLPNALINSYFACSGVLLVVLSLLNGLLAQKLSESKTLPLSLAGILTMAATTVATPVLLFVLTIGLLAVFRMI